MSRTRTFRAPHRARAGTAMTETVILAPLYMIMLFGLIFLGYSTLARQKEQVAAHYIAAQPGLQPADEMMAEFFPWNPTDASYRSLPDGSEATAGSATLRVHETLNEPDVYAPDWGSVSGVPVFGDTFDGTRIVEYLWVMAVGSMEQHFEWRDGDIVEVIERHDDYRSRYLRNQEIVNPPPPAGPVTTKYLNGVAYGLNCTQDPSWLVRRHAQLEYLYTPPFFRHVYGGEPMGRSEYFSLNTPEPTFTPNYRNETRIMTRGEGGRANSPQAGYAVLLRDMERLLDEPWIGNMPAPMSEAELAGLWPEDAGSPWVAE